MDRRDTTIRVTSAVRQSGLSHMGKEARGGWCIKITCPFLIHLQKKADQLLETLLGNDFVAAKPLIKPLLLVSFGSFTRMDYGTGHETSFALFLLCLTLIRFLKPVVEEERDIVLRIFVRYLHLCWKLQDVYRLEPAGSHGVWGLDDYSFLGYILGSGQVRGSSFQLYLFC